MWRGGGARRDRGEGEKGKSSGTRRMNGSSGWRAADRGLSYPPRGTTRNAADWWRFHGGVKCCGWPGVYGAAKEAKRNREGKLP